ncbi:MAG TPA: aspartyl protease family protein [Gemmatimonadaceae bacterium]|nr:aspartyl protease family protein [Gemmatimonadaceae bacterium]
MVRAMGLLRTMIAVAPLSAPERRLELEEVLVDTGSEYSWLPAVLLHSLGIVPVRADRFETADGRVLDRDVGFAMIHAGGRSTPSLVVFAHHSDTVLLGAIALQGLNVRVDLVRRALVSGGPIPVPSHVAAQRWWRSRA